MNIDLRLLRAREVAGSWSAAAAVEAARGLGGGRPDTLLDRDDGAGESWVRVLAGDAVIAYVCTALPLAMVDSHAADTTRLGSAVQSIVVGSLADPVLSGSQAGVENAFGHSERFSMLDLDRFSADDLWYVTV